MIVAIWLPGPSIQGHLGAPNNTQEHPDKHVYKAIDDNPLVNLVYKGIVGSPL